MWSQDFRNDVKSFVVTPLKADADVDVDVHVNVNMDYNDIDKLAQKYISFWYGIRLEFLAALVIAIVFFAGIYTYALQFLYCREEFFTSEY